ncbi:MAG: hypothetical protein ACHQT8_02500 [Chlamydiales bacterium]
MSGNTVQGVGTRTARVQSPAAVAPAQHRADVSDAHEQSSLCSLSDRSCCGLGGWIRLACTAFLRFCRWVTGCFSTRGSANPAPIRHDEPAAAVELPAITDAPTAERVAAAVPFDIGAVRLFLKAWPSAITGDTAAFDEARYKTQLFELPFGPLNTVRLAVGEKYPKEWNKEYPRFNHTAGQTQVIWDKVDAILPNHPNSVRAILKKWLKERESN